jgi:deoxycytidine triphosphate deaminase
LFDPRILLEEKERLSNLPYFQQSLESSEIGVLRSDRIKHYCKENCKLIDPSDVEFLRPAGYDLRVGFHYAIGGEAKTLNYGETVTIGPYQVAVIQTLETLNIPEFLIGRWNIRVGLAYKGLLWVGGAQVDPGFRGKLSCPIYNLSTQPVKLKCGDELAMIDFVTTTKFIAGESKPFQWWDRKKLVFQQYATGLRSGVEDNLSSLQAELKADKDSLDENLSKQSNSLLETMEKLQSRIDLRLDTFLTLIFTVVAVLFAGLGVVATKGSDDPSFVSSPVWVAAVALYFALKPYAIIWSASRKTSEPADSPNAMQSSSRQWIDTLKPKFVEILVAVIIVFGSVAFHVWSAHVSARELTDQKKQVDELAKIVKQQKEMFDAQLQENRVQSDAKYQSLEKQIEFLKRK